MYFSVNQENAKIVNLNHQLNMVLLTLYDDFENNFVAKRMLSPQDKLELRLFFSRLYMILIMSKIFIIHGAFGLSEIA